MSVGKRVEERSRQANYQHRHRAEGLCVTCSTVAGINPRTGKSYRHCHVHRAQVAAVKKEVMRQRRKDGLA